MATRRLIFTQSLAENVILGNKNCTIRVPSFFNNAWETGDIALIAEGFRLDNDRWRYIMDDALVPNVPPDFHPKLRMFSPMLCPTWACRERRVVTVEDMLLSEITPKIMLSSVGTCHPDRVRVMWDELYGPGHFARHYHSAVRVLWLNSSKPKSIRASGRYL